MTKIIQAINQMIEHSEKITNVAKKNQEFAFSYKGYIWSILAVSTSAIYLYYYPKVKNVSELTAGDNPRLVMDFVSYTSSDFKTKEAEESFNALYSIVKEKFYGLDQMFKDIINDTGKK